MKKNVLFLITTLITSLADAQSFQVTSVQFTSHFYEVSAKMPEVGQFYASTRQPALFTLTPSRNLDKAGAGFMSGSSIDFGFTRPGLRHELFAGFGRLRREMVLYDYELETDVRGVSEKYEISHFHSFFTLGAGYAYRIPCRRKWTFFGGLRLDSAFPVANRTYESYQFKDLGVGWDEITREHAYFGRNAYAVGLTFPAGFSYRLKRTALVWQISGGWHYSSIDGTPVLLRMGSQQVAIRINLNREKS